MFDRIFFRVLSTIVILALVIGFGVTLFEVLTVGQYWATAPIYLTALVAVVIPCLVLFFTAKLLNAIWRSDK